MYSILYCVSVILSIYKFITNIFLHIYFLHFIANIKEKKYIVMNKRLCIMKYYIKGQVEEMFEDIKKATRISKSKEDRQHNDQ